jgi:GAF domain-containing protein
MAAGAQQSVYGQMTLVVAFSLVLAISVIAHALSARIQRGTAQRLREHDDALRAIQAVGAERQQRLERANTALRRQLRNAELAAEMGRLAAVGLQLDELVSQAVELVRQGIGADHVGLYLLDESRAFGRLHAVSGSLHTVSGHPCNRLPVKDDILLRQCVRSGRPQIVLGLDDVQELTGRKEGSAFVSPATRSALALPLVAHGVVFGALNIQSCAPTAFDNVDIASLRTTVDQLSSAISNAQLAQELGEQLAHVESLRQYYVREAWEQFLAEGSVGTYEYHQPEVEPLGEGPLPGLERVFTDPRLVAVSESNVSGLLIPIVLREQVLGVLGLHQLDAEHPWTEEEMALLAAVSEQMGLTLENARLFAEARSRAALERRARQVVARLRRSLDVEEVLSTAAQEIGDALQLEGLTVRLTGPEEAIGG